MKMISCRTFNPTTNSIDQLTLCSQFHFQSNDGGGRGSGGGGAWLLHRTSSNERQQLLMLLLRVKCSFRTWIKRRARFTFKSEQALFNALSPGS